MWPLICVAIVLNGLVYPCYSALFGIIYVIGRVIYGFFYARDGPKGRMIGSIISHLGDFPLMIMLYFSGYQFLDG